MSKVAVILSTYNGERFLKEQIESILNQTYTDLDLIVRDDGSKDSTISIIEEYISDNSNIKLIKEENIGFINSFYRILEIAEGYEYYCFADQDDVWEKEKIEFLINELDKTDPYTPNLVFSDSDYYNENMKLIKKGHTNRKSSFRNSLVECVSQGMTMMINKTARDIVIQKKSKNSIFHDQWCYMICSGLGEVKYVPKALVRYRRLNNNVTAEGRGIITIFKWRIEKLLIGSGLKKFKTQILDFKELFYNELDENKKRLLDLFTKKYNLINAMKKFFYPKRFRRKLLDEIIVRILFLFGIL